MNIFIWVLQVLLGLLFIFVGVLHFTIPDTLPALMSWMRDLSPAMNAFTGFVEIAGGLGLVLPGLTKIQTRLTPLAAAGLSLVMFLAIFSHIPRGEFQNVGANVVLFLLTGFIAYRRLKVNPLAEKAS